MLLDSAGNWYTGEQRGLHVPQWQTTVTVVTQTGPITSKAKDPAG
jgi:hypothetical protein